MEITYNKSTLGIKGNVVDDTRMRYQCPGCGKQCNTKYGNFKRYEWKGLCAKCIFATKKIITIYNS